MAFEGLIYYSGIQSLLSASVTLTHGITPNVSTLYIPPQPTEIPINGALTLTYGRARVQLQRCRVDRVDVTQDAEGKEVWRLSILDRRWVWRRTGRISGFYNVRRGKDIDPDTDKTPRELAKLCLEAMDERGFDLRAMPNDARPAVEWDYTNPAEALQDVCEQVGCRVVLGLDDKVRIWPQGVGRELSLVNILTGEITSDPPETPDRLVIVGDYDRWQVDFELEAVGLDTDGTIKPIDELTYTPRPLFDKTWKYSDWDHFQDVTDEKAKQLAQETVGKWYRITTPIQLQGERKRIEERWRVLPLLKEQIETDTIDDREQPRGPWVYGEFYGGEEAGANRVTIREAIEGRRLVNIFYYARYLKPFNLDAEQGIVQFREPVYRHVAADDGGWLIEPADLRLRTCCNLRDKDTRGWQRTEYQLRNRKGEPLRGTKRYVVKDDIRRDRYRVTESDREVDTLRDSERQAAYYLQAEALQYQYVVSGSVVYPGFVAFQPDGAIQQISWLIDDQGFATTQVSRNREQSIVTPSYEERRMYERLAESTRTRETAAAGRRDVERKKG